LPRWLRWTGRLIAGLLVLVVLALIAVYLVTSLAIRRTYNLPESTVRAATDSASLAWGRHLVEAIGKCQECHGDDYGGKVLSDDPMFGRLSGPNLTSGRGGIGERTDADLERAIRHGVGPGGRALFFMPAEAFTVLSVEDLADVLGYLRTLRPVDRETPPPRVGPIARALYLGGSFPLLPAELVDHANRPPKPAEGVTVAYGDYLATAGGCKGCHGNDLAGTGAPDAANITPAGIGSWTEADFFRAIREGRRPDGTIIDSIMPWKRTAHMTDDEIRAVWLYLKSVPPRQYGMR